jgi:steroid delta-isomerase-like uncharacterized protein
MTGSAERGSMRSRQVLEQWIEAFNKHDVATLISCYEENAVNHQVASGDPVTGLETIRSDFESLFAGFPDIYAEVENIMSDGDWAAWEWVGGGTFSGPFLGSEPTGNSYRMRGCGFFEIRGGKIEVQRGYWDRDTWFSQVGLK